MGCFLPLVEILRDDPSDIQFYIGHGAKAKGDVPTPHAATLDYWGIK
jgi:hypothetical protein